jgi:putative endonuclease
LPPRKRTYAQVEMSCKSDNKKIGRIGESLAKDFLLKRGYKIIAENYQSKYLEIDLIAARKKRLVFIEVKTRIGKFFGTPEEALTTRKIRRLVRNALIYTAFTGYRGKYQIDALCLVLNKSHSLKRITHYQNITF